jgi:prophage tail gpP-like protein
MAVWPKPTELAILTVNGQKYQEWESVLVRHAKYETPFYTFRFTCSEDIPLAKNFSVLQIKPGDYCTITLAGELAFNGLVHTRQVFYNDRRHQIEIQGACRILALSYASVVSKTMEQNNVTYEQYARALLNPHKINFVVEGGALPQIKFPRLSVSHGTTVMEALEIPLRSLGGVALTSNVKGDLVANVGPVGGSDTVVEGVNILEGREIIFNPGMAQGI